MDPTDPCSPASYFSVGKEARAEFSIEKSRFIALIKPVSSEDAAKSFIDEVRQDHRSATHVVPAYIIGAGGNLMRFSDDGEPQGTAGVPALDVLRKEELTDVVLAIVRYFGGIKLGAGGLVRAYARAAAEAVHLAGVCEMMQQEQWRLTVSYSLSGTVGHRLNKAGWQPEVRYDEAVHYALYVPLERREELLGELNEWTGGQVEVKRGAVVYAPAPKAVSDKQTNNNSLR